MAKKRKRRTYKGGPPDEFVRSIVISWASEFELIAVLTSDINKSRKARDEFFGVPYDSDNEVAGLFCARGCYGYIFLGHTFDPDTVAHEVYHLVDYMMDHIGVKHRDGEVMAYHLGWLVGRISELYLEAKKEKDKKAKKELDTSKEQT